MGGCAFLVGEKKTQKKTIVNTTDSINNSNNTGKSTTTTTTSDGYGRNYLYTQACGWKSSPFKTLLHTWCAGFGKRGLAETPHRSLQTSHHARRSSTKL